LKALARASAVLLDELNGRRLKGASDYVNGRAPWLLNHIDMDQSSHWLA